MTGMELSIQAWCLNFQTLWLEVCDTTPDIRAGTTPIKDLLLTKKSAQPGPAWFYYSRRKFKEGYWEAFDLIMADKHPTVDFGVATSEFFTTMYDFGYEDGDEIPDLVLVCFDIPGQTIKF
jgi:hypothetical protein